jgi:hypothetical protein
MACAVSGITPATRGARNALCQLQKSQRPQYDTDLLDSSAHQLSELFLILRGHFDAEGWTSHDLSMSQNISRWNCFISKSSRGQRPSVVSPN